MVDRTWNVKSWDPWSQPAAPLYLTLTLTPSFAPLKKLIGQPLFTSIIVFESDIATWVYRKDEAASLGQRMIDILQVPIHRSAFEDTLHLSITELQSAIADTSDRVPATLQECVTAFLELERTFTNFYSLGAFVEPVRTAAQRHFSALLDDRQSELMELISVDNRSEVEASLYVIESESFTTEILMSLAIVAGQLEVSAESTPQLLQALNDYCVLQEEFLRLSADAESGKIVDVSLQAALDKYPDRLEQSLQRIGEIALEISPLASAIDRHIAAFSWSANNYLRCVYLSPITVLKDILVFGRHAYSAIQAQLTTINDNRMLDLARKRQLLAALSPYDASLLSIHDYVGVYLSDIRKSLVMRLNGAVARLLEFLGTFVNMTVSDLTLLLPQEIAKIETNVERYRERLDSRRQGFLIYQSDISVMDEQPGATAIDAEGRISYNRHLAVPEMDGPVLAEGSIAVTDLIDRLGARLDFIVETPGSRPVRGTPIYFDRECPTIRGRVRVIRDPHRDSIQPGEILVAMSTTPDFIVAIHKCAAIVTDYGGFTSHAAITARELGKPCVIGTNYGSFVLTSGDVVDVNFETGEVLRIEDADTHREALK